ncbi:MAG: GNAT family N-acetyltransferase, partial [Candidatus Lindowbacteria bacterium]|nr:GNAT family N-acetyltransferase [Candidatus Lindowbacteria bacterium]
GKVIGYLVGCRDATRQEEIQKSEVMPRIRKKLFTFGYRIDLRFFKFMWRWLRSMRRGEFVDVPVDGYPAHLHMNLAEGYRSSGTGSKLMTAYLDYLRANNVKGLHLGTTTRNKLAVPFYRKWGFRLVSRHPLTMYEGIVPEKVEILSFTREI